MIVKDPGHHYLLGYLDQEDKNKTAYGEVIYVKREGENYPGNVGHHQGTTMQETLRANIHRALYVNNQKPNRHTMNGIKHMRLAILDFETRSAEIHGRELKNVREDIENEPTCQGCGHIQCDGSCRRISKHE